MTEHHPNVEPFAEAWARRFGNTAEVAIDTLSPFLGHRSVRRFLPTPIAPSLQEALFACAQSASTSSNLHLWSAVNVTDPELRHHIAEVAADQSHVREAPLFLVFLADHHRLRQAAHAVGEAADGLDFMEFEIMAIVDAAIAAERLVCAAESLGLGVCYIGAVRNDVERIADLLKLPHGVAPLFGLCVGYPDSTHDAEIKPRLQTSLVVFENQYRSRVDVSEYDERMRSFYESQNMKGAVTWSMRSGRRVGADHLHGRAILKQWLEARGFGVR